MEVKIVLVSPWRSCWLVLQSVRGHEKWHAHVRAHVRQDSWSRAYPTGGLWKRCWGHSYRNKSIVGEVRVIQARSRGRRVWGAMWLPAAGRSLVRGHRKVGRGLLLVMIRRLVDRIRRGSNAILGRLHLIILVSSLGLVKHVVPRVWVLGKCQLRTSYASQGISASTSAVAGPEPW
jgi:hypothetical protein